MSGTGEEECADVERAAAGGPCHAREQDGPGRAPRSGPAGHELDGRRCSSQASSPSQCPQTECSQQQQRTRWAAKASRPQGGWPSAESGGRARRAPRGATAGCSAPGRERGRATGWPAEWPWRAARLPERRDGLKLHHRATMVVTSGGRLKQASRRAKGVGPRGSSGPRLGYLLCTP